MVQKSSFFAAERENGSTMASQNGREIITAFSFPFRFVASVLFTVFADSVFSSVGFSVP